MAAVILTNHYNRQLRRDPLDVPVIQTPKHVLGAVAADSQIQRVPVGIIVRPDLFALLVVVFHDGVAYVNEVDVTLLGLSVH